MARPPSDIHFETSFFEAIHQRDPRFTDVVEILGGLYTKQGRIADGLRMDRKLVRLRPENATAHYNLACSLALSRRGKDALRALERAVALGYDDREWMEQDPDLVGLRKLPAFQKLLAKLPPPG
jgi:tetratricopeptide (TPR) repeat protein